MQLKTALVALTFLAAGNATVAQVPSWQAKMESERRDAAAGNVSVFAITPRSGLDASWAAGVHVYYNAPRPFCYAYVFPGEWYPLRSKPGVPILPDKLNCFSMTPAILTIFRTSPRRAQCTRCQLRRQ